MTHTRFLEIDFFRGLAVIGMLIYHFFFILNFFELTQFELQEGSWLALARFVQLIFLLSVGVSMALVVQKYSALELPKSFIYKKLFRHAFVIFICALIVSGVTWIAAPTEFVRFGILHFIAVSIVLLSSMAFYPRFAFLFGILVILLTPFAQFLSDNPFLYPFGNTSFPALDYFPLFPWMNLVAFGIALGHYAFQRYERRFLYFLPESRVIHSVAWLGRRSLAFYMLHIPFLFGIIWWTKYILLKTYAF